MLFLLKDHQGSALIMAQAGSQAEADAFGRSHLPEFCGESIEIDMGSRLEAEEFWGVRTVRLVSVRLNPTASSKPKTAVLERPLDPSRVPAMAKTTMWMRRPTVPADVESDGLLTQGDYRDLTVEHIRRTSEFVAHVQILKLT